jgi:hypothetical protein
MGLKMKSMPFSNELELRKYITYNVINVWTVENVGCMDGYSVTVTAYDAEVILVQDAC